LGAIRQELLSGIREEEKFVKLRNYLRAFDEPGIDIADYEEAAHMHNPCRRRSGGSGTFLQLTATLSGIGECWGLGCLRSREAKIGDTSGAKADMN
jgi:hypothetical protein